MERILIVYPHAQWLKAASALLKGRDFQTFEDYAKALEHLDTSPAYAVVCCGLDDRLAVRIFEKALERNEQARLIGIIRNKDQVKEFALKWKKARQPEFLGETFTVSDFQQLQLIKKLPHDESEILSTKSAQNDLPLFHQPSQSKPDDLAAKSAENDFPVLIEGEPGTGKRTVAFHIHRLSMRGKARMPFRIVHCSEASIAGCLFGDSYTQSADQAQARPSPVEQAEGGTIILAGAEQLSNASQLALLEFLEGVSLGIAQLPLGRAIPPDVRVIATCNRALRPTLDRGFRSDLFYGLSSNYIRLLSLRERPDEIDGLVSGFLKSIRSRNRGLEAGVADNSGESSSQFSPRAKAILRSYQWPGNIRELQFVIQYAALRATGQIDVAHLPPWVVNSTGRTGSPV